MAAIAFPSARAAGRRIAGVAAAARIVRELSCAGFTGVWLRVADGDAIDAAALADVARLAGSTAVRIGEPPAHEPVAALPGDRLIPSEAIAPFLAGEWTYAEAAIDLTRRDAAAEILRRTGKPTDGPVSRWINRPVSRAISAVLLRVPGLRPIHATVGTALLAVLMVIALVLGSQPGLIAGGILFQAASVFDGVDGEVARATFRTSRAGAALDTTIDTLANVLFVAGIAINLALRGDGTAVALAGWGLALFLLGLALIGWHAVRTGGPFSFNRIKLHYRRRAPGPAVAALIAWLTVITSRDFFALFAAVLVVAGFALEVLYLFTVAASIWVLFVAASLLPSRKGALAPDGA